MKKFFFIAVLVVSANIAFAQDKYEFMTIQYESFKPNLIICLNGETVLKEKLDLEKEENFPLNSNPILKKIKEYQDKGWEMLTLTTNFAPYPSYYSVLRKKKN